MKTTLPALLVAAASSMVAVAQPKIQIQIQAVQADQVIQVEDLNVRQIVPGRPIIRPNPVGQPVNPTVQVDTRNVDSVNLVNGEVLRGTFIGLEPAEGLKWKHDAIKEILTIAPTGFRSIRLDRPRSYKTTPPNCRVYLRNGDQLAGNLASLDANALRLETSYAGTLAVPRKEVQTVFIIYRATDAIYEGPTGLEDWHQTGRGNGMARQIMINGNVAIMADAAVAWAGEDGAPQRAQPNQPPSSWQFKDGALVATNYGSIGRTFKMPAGGVSLEFDLECSGYPQFTVHFCTDALDREYGANAYVFQFSQRMIYVRRQTHTGNNTMLGNCQWNVSSGQNRVHIAIRAHRQQKAVGLYVDENLVGKWNDKTEMGPDANGLVFWQQGNIPTRISNIRVAEWEGLLDESSASAGAAKEDTLVFNNQDKVTGQLNGIKDGKAQIKTAFTELSIPLERMSRFILAAADPSTTTAPKGARLQFRDFGRITLTLERADEQTLEGTSPMFGHLKLNPAAFKHIDLDPQPITATSPPTVRPPRPIRILPAPAQPHIMID